MSSGMSRSGGHSRVRAVGRVRWLGGRGESVGLERSVSSAGRKARGDDVCSNESGAISVCSSAAKAVSRTSEITRCSSTARDWVSMGPSPNSGAWTASLPRERTSRLRSRSRPFIRPWTSRWVILRSVLGPMTLGVERGTEVRGKSAERR